MFIPFPKPSQGIEKCKRWIVSCSWQFFTEKSITRNTYICALNWPGEKGPTVEFADPLNATFTPAQAHHVASKKRKAPTSRATPAPKIAKIVYLFIYLFSPFYWAGFVAQRERAQQDSKVPYKVPHLTHPPFTYERQPQHRDHPTLIRIVRVFFNVPQNYQHSRNCETGPPVYRPYPRRLESLTICRWNYKGSTFLLSYLKTLSGGPVGVSNSRPPASQPSAQPSEPR